MAFQVSPGVNVTELDFTSIVPAAATSLAAISFPTEWGPANEPVLIDTPKTFREIFGDVKEWNAANYFTALNFLSYARGLLMVRAMGGTANTSNANSAGLAVGAAGSFAPNDEYDITNLKGGFYARYAGEKGNSLAVSIGVNEVTGAWEYNRVFNRGPAWTENIAALAGTTGTKDAINLVVVDEDGLFTGTRGEVLERYEGLSLHPKARRADGTSLYFKNVLNEQSKYVKVGGKVDSYDLDLDYFESGGNGIFHDTLQITGVFSSNWEDNYEFTFGATKHVTVSLTGGAGSNFTGDRTEVGKGIGYDKLADAEKIDVNLIMAGDLSDPTSLQNLKGIVENRKDAMLFVSCDVGKNGGNLNDSDSQKATQCVNFKNSIGSSSYVVIDSGYKRQFDPYNQVSRWVPLNGDTAGLVARTESDLDAWWSPAGYNRGILNNANSALAFNPNKTFRDRIYPKGINPIISESGTGLILLGDRTALSRPSAFDRINVRRLFIVIEKAIATASKFSLFEFNDSFTRSRFASLVVPYLRDVQSRRGIVDFKVVCDESNNTPERIDRNEFWADIYIKPNRSINFIQLNFIATRSGASFTEVGA